MEFLQAETRNDYYISSKMKKTWQIQIEMLEEVKRICEKYNIIYLADSGTLLGAIRHNGFIPWDDDIDLGMTRDMYEKFLEVAPKELNPKFFLQHTKSEKHYFCPHAQIRCYGTTMLLGDDYKKNKNKGIFIDIFVYDKVPLNDQLGNKLRNKLALQKKILYFEMSKLSFGNIIKNLVKKTIAKMYLITHGGFNKVAQNYNKLSQKYQYLEKDYYYDYVSYYTNTRKIVLPANVNDDVSAKKFEYTTINIPKDYDLILKNMFGEYLKPVQAPSDHGHIYIDPDKSYLEYDKLNLQEFKELFEDGLQD